MLIKTFKFLTKDYTVHTKSFDENGQPIKGYFLNMDNYKGDGDHVSFPMYFSNIGNKIVSKYIDLIIKKYNIPREKWESTIKIKTTTSTDPVTNNNYIIYVCAFSGISYKGDISIDEFIPTKIEESEISENAITATYDVCGDFIIEAPNDAVNNAINSEIDTIKILLEVRNRDSIVLNKYIYEYKINDTTHEFYNNVYTLSNYYSYETGETTILEPTTVSVPRYGKLFCNIQDINEIKTLYNIDRQISYGTKRINDIVSENLPIKMIDNRSYFYLDKIHLKEGNDITTMHGKITLYPESKIIDDSVSPVTNKTVVYAIMYNIDETSSERTRVYNVDEGGSEYKYKLYTFHSGEEYTLEVNHNYPYVEFSLSDNFSNSIESRQQDSHYYLYKLTMDDTRLSEIVRDVNLYDSSTETISLNISIPSSQEDRINCKILCFYDNPDEPLHIKNITLTKSNSLGVFPFINITTSFLKYSKIIVVSENGKYSSKMFNLYTNYNVTQNSGITTSVNIKTDEITNIILYPVTSYNISTQVFYGDKIRILYYDKFNREIEKELVTNLNFYDIVVNQVNYDLSNIGISSYLNKLESTEELFPMPGTPIFMWVINPVDNEVHKEYNTNYTYKLNSQDYIPQYVIKNNCDVQDLTAIKYTDIQPRKYFLSFNEYDEDNISGSQLIREYIKISGKAYFRGPDSQAKTIYDIADEYFNDGIYEITYQQPLLSMNRSSSYYRDITSYANINYKIYDLSYFYRILETTISGKELNTFDINSFTEKEKEFLKLVITDFTGIDTNYKMLEQLHEKMYNDSVDGLIYNYMLYIDKDIYATKNDIFNSGVKFYFPQTPQRSIVLNISTNNIINNQINLE